MAIKSSTGALTDEQKQAQNKRYEEGHEYDYVFIGTGHSALSCAALLANAGKKVCMLEAHDTPGGYAHTFRQGEFHFCAQVHYIWGCGPGEKFNVFLNKLGIEQDISFELYDPDGYDHIVLPDGKRVKFPYGFDRLAESIASHYPDQKESINNFVQLMKKIRSEMKKLPIRPIKWWEKLIKWPQFLTLLKYRKATLQNVFEECKLSKEVQAVFGGNAGDFGAPPDELSIFAFVGLMSGYNTGAYYPTKHYKHYIQSLADFIVSKDGCHIYYETPVEKIKTEFGRVTEVTTKDGKSFNANEYICNADPQKAAKNLIGWEKFSPEMQKKLSYEYSPSGIMIYLGLKDIDLKKLGFGKFNIWHLQSWDMNENWHKKDLDDRFSDIWFFMSTPTLHSNAPGTTPGDNYEIMEVASFVNYDLFKDAQDRSYAEYAKLKMQYAEKLIDLVAKYYIPDIRKHIVVKTIGSPTTFEDYAMAPQGNAYGANLTPAHLSLGKLKRETGFANLHWCNATSGAAGMHGTLATGMQLYMDLTGDEFYTGKEAASDEDLVERSIKAATA